MNALTSTGTSPTAATPSWAHRKAERSIPGVVTPSLRSVDAAHLIERQFGLICFFIARVGFASAAIIVCLHQRWWIGLLPAAWLCYGGATTAVHHLIHSSMGLQPRTRRFWLTTLGLVVLESGHSLKATHLLHHRSDADAPDPEGYIEYVPWRRMPIEAFRFHYRLRRWGLSHGRDRGRIRCEIGFHVAFHVVALALMPFTWIPAAYALIILLSAASFAVLAGKGPQTSYGRAVATPLVIVRSRLGQYFFFSHDRHLEHHLYPKVPLPRLRHLEATIADVLHGHELVEVRCP